MLLGQSGNRYMPNYFTLTFFENLDFKEMLSVTALIFCSFKMYAVNSILKY